MTEYRFATVTNPHDPTDVAIYRARLINVGHDNSWSDYFDGSTMVGFYDDGWSGRRVIDGLDPVAAEDSERAVVAYQHERWPIHQTGGDYGYSVHGLALQRAARRIALAQGYPPHVAWEADFICVPLDRGRTLYLLATGGPADQADLREEIEALNLGDIFDVEVEQYTPGGWFGGDWTPAEPGCEWWYGERAAEREFARHYPMTEFPAELLVSAQD